nr:hypothetical protein [uncultured Pseudomonas sp.]
MIQEKKCYFCGETANTREHVPPKGFFPKETRKNLITVSACEVHNNHKSGDDEYFRMTLAGIAWSDLPTSMQETIIRSVKRKPALARHILETSKKNDTGWFTYDADGVRIDHVLECIGRGLLFREQGKIFKELSFFLKNFMHLNESAPSEYIPRYRLAQKMMPDLLLEIEAKGENPKIFQYKIFENYVQFTFYEKHITTMAFNE